jgi:hypothetical protein
MKLSEDERAGLDVLRAKMTEDLAMEVVKFRRMKKAPITARIARALLKEYEAYGNIEEAVDKHLVRGWVGFEAIWVKKAQGFTDQNHPTPRPSVNYGQAEIVKPPEPLTEEEKARRHAKAAEARALLAGASTSMRMN